MHRTGADHKGKDQAKLAAPLKAVCLIGRTGIDDLALSVMELKARDRVRLVFSFYDDQVLSCVHRQSFHLRMRAIDLRVVHPHLALAHDSLNGIIHTP